MMEEKYKKKEKEIKEKCWKIKSFSFSHTYNENANWKLNKTFRFYNIIAFI